MGKGNGHMCKITKYGDKISEKIQVEDKKHGKGEWTHV